MPFAFPLVLLMALLAAELPPAATGIDLSWRLLAVAVAAVAPPLLAMGAAAVTARVLTQGAASAHRQLARYDRLRRAAYLLWIAGVATIALVFGWGQIVRNDLRLRDAVLIDELLILLPVVAPLVLLWAAAHRVEEALVRAALESGAATRRMPARLSYVLTHARHEVLPVMLPVLAAIALADGLRLVPHGWNDSQLAAGVVAPFVLLLAAIFPWMLRLVWQTRELAAGELRDRLVAASARCGQPIDKLLVWHTGGRIANAAVTGFVPGCRFVLLSDGLLAQLSPAEVEAVFLHELGHLHHRHLVARGLAAAAPLAVVGLLSKALALDFSEWATALGSLGLTLLAAFGSALTVAYVWFIFGRYARLLENQADLFACARLGVGHEPTAEVTSVYTGALRHLTALAGGRPRRRGWQHDGLEVRLTRLAELCGSQDARRSFARRLRALAMAFLMVDVAGLAAWLLS